MDSWSGDHRNSDSSPRQGKPNAQSSSPLFFRWILVRLSWRAKWTGTPGTDETNPYSIRPQYCPCFALEGIPPLLERTSAADERRRQPPPDDSFSQLQHRGNSSKAIGSLHVVESGSSCGIGAFWKTIGWLAPSLAWDGPADGPNGRDAIIIRIGYSMEHT